MKKNWSRAIIAIALVFILLALFIGIKILLYLGSILLIGALLGSVFGIFSSPFNKDKHA